MLDRFLLGQELMLNLMVTALILVALTLIRYLALAFVYKRMENVRQQYLAKKYLSYAVAFVGLFLIGRVWVDGFHSLATFLGLLSAGIAIALKDVILDMAGWVYLGMRKPFELGDRIEIGDLQGDVIDKRVLKFSVMEIGNWVDADQSTGRVVHVPNHRIFSQSIYNYTQGFQFIWNELPVRLTFESDWRKAKAILQKLAEKHASEITPEAARQIRETAREFMIINTVLNPTVYTEVRDFGIQLTVRYMTHPRRRRGSAQMIWEDVLTEFAQHPDITFAYPTTRFVLTTDHDRFRPDIHPHP
jgi:small-conductance mechanosensitive channel